jgi:hypothetical protein
MEQRHWVGDDLGGVRRSADSYARTDRCHDTTDDRAISHDAATYHNHDRADGNNRAD